MTLQDLIFLPILAFIANFLVGYIAVQLISFIKKTIW